MSSKLVKKLLQQTNHPPSTTDHENSRHAKLQKQKSSTAPTGKLPRQRKKSCNHMSNQS
eukprot:CCRYP_015600-RA/>CCRYP_015600-RA protein AED:0.30 eAED:0.30 QI:0/-1/0/1/-1/0/1/0/58